MQKQHCLELLQKQLLDHALAKLRELVAEKKARNGETE